MTQLFLDAQEALRPTINREEPEILDPSNPYESEQLYFYDLQLSHHLKVLEHSYKKARIKELGFSIVR